MLAVVLNTPPAIDQLAAVAVALRLVSWPPVRTRPGLALDPRVSVRVLPPVNTSVAVPDRERTSPVAVYWVLAVALKVPPAMDQLAAVAVALRLVSWPPVRTRPGLALDPRVSVRVLPPVNTSVAVPDRERTSPVAVYWVLAVALKVPPAMDQLVAVAVAFRLVSWPPVRTSPGLSLEPSVRARVLPPLKTSEPVPERNKLSPVAVY